MSTIHVDTSSLSVSRTLDESRLLVNCPPCFPGYQEFMGGVDLSDQQMSYYYVQKNGGREFFPCVLEACCQNAYVLKIYGQENKKRKDPSYLEFRLEFVEQLIGTFCSKAKRGCPRSASPVDIRLDASKQHLPVVAEHIECVVCNKVCKTSGATRSTLRHESQFRCSTCSVSLCLSENRNCFFKYIWNRFIGCN